MNKNWLIRTRSNHLLGPISREKLLDLIENGSIHEEDEVCSGNGYWFFVRETDLVTKYVYEQHPQPFNPISEALNERIHRQNGNADLLSHDDVTRVGSVEEKLPESQLPRSAPDVGSVREDAPAGLSENVKVGNNTNVSSDSLSITDVNLSAQEFEVESEKVKNLESQLEIAHEKDRLNRLSEMHVPVVTSVYSKAKVYVFLLVLLIVVMIALVYKKNFLFDLILSKF